MQKPLPPMGERVGTPARSRPDGPLGRRSRLDEILMAKHAGQCRSFTLIAIFSANHGRARPTLRDCSFALLNTDLGSR